MKKLLPLLLLMLLCITPAMADHAVLLTPAPTEIPGLTLRPSADEVKVYASPNMKANIVGYIIVNGRQEVHVLSRQGEWYYVSFTSIYGVSYGWIPASCFQREATPTPRPAVTATPVVQAEGFVRNPQQGYRLNLRAAPSADSISLGKYYTGTPVTMTGEVQSGFTKVRIGGVTGWMDSRYLTTNPYAFRSELPVVTVVNPGGGLNLREGPGTNYRKVGWYPHGASITVLGVREDEWYHVAIGGQTGFMSSTLMSETFPWQFGTDSDSAILSGNFFGGAEVYVSAANTSGLALKEYASFAAPSLGVFYSGCPVTIISCTRSGWAYVRIGGMQGYVDLGALTTSRPYQTGKTRVVSNPYGTGLNLRTAPGMSSAVIRLCPNRSVVTVLGDVADGWSYVQAGSDYGYMMGQRLSAR